MASELLPRRTTGISRFTTAVDAGTLSHNTARPTKRITRSGGHLSAGPWPAWPGGAPKTRRAEPVWRRVCSVHQSIRIRKLQFVNCSRSTQHRHSLNNSQCTTPPTRGLPAHRDSQRDTDTVSDRHVHSEGGTALPLPSHSTNSSSSNGRSSSGVPSAICCRSTDSDGGGGGGGAESPSEETERGSADSDA